MVIETNDSIEQKILSAAKKVFIRAGFSGGKMQAIADEAGINKAALHYYFRSKDKLFDIIFKEAFKQMFERISSIIDDESPFEKKIDKLIEEYIDFFSNNHYLMPFLVFEMIKNPEFINKIIELPELKSKPKKIIKQIEESIAAGCIKQIDPIQLYLNIVSMCAFPFLARPVFCSIFGVDDKKFNRLMQERPKILTQFIKDAVFA